jgi:hypothetical protein
MIYFVQAEGVGHIKIGYTDGESADSRLATLQTGSPVPLRILHTMPGTMEDEKNLHRRFASAGVGGEWFKAVPDLLAMIPAAERKACEGVDVAERSVSIRVLTVGRKQFTKSLLAQLPQYTAFDWHAVVDDISCQGDDEPGQLRFPSTLFSKQGAREAVDQYDFAELVAPPCALGVGSRRPAAAQLPAEALGHFRAPRPTVPPNRPHAFRRLRGRRHVGRPVSANR